MPHDSQSPITAITPRTGTQPCRRIASLIMSGLLLLVGVGACTQTTEASGSEAFRVLAKEQSLAESYVGLWNTLGKGDFRRYADGIRLYASAKAEFDGLIEQMKQDLIQGRPLDRSTKFNTILQSAVEKRMAFTRHVDETVDAMAEGTRRGVKDYVGSAAALISALTDAGKVIWDEYQESEEVARKATLAQLDALKWKPFHELTGSS